MARDLATPALQTKLQTLVAGGGLFVEVVGIDLAASKQDLTTWVTNYKLTITSVRDPNGAWPQSQRVFMTREWSFIVDLATMKIVSEYFGSHGGGQPSTDALNHALDDVIARL